MTAPRAARSAWRPRPPRSPSCSPTERRAPRPNMTAGQAELARELARPTMAPRLATWYRRLCLTAGRTPRPHHPRRESDLLPAAADRRRRGRWRRPRERDVIAAFPARVLEVKHCGDMPYWLGRRWSRCNRRKSFSKFRNGDDGARARRRRGTGDGRADGGRSGASRSSPSGPSLLREGGNDVCRLRRDRWQRQDDNLESRRQGPARARPQGRAPARGGGISPPR